MKTVKWGVFVVLIMLFPISGHARQKLVVATGEWAPYVSESLEDKGFMTEILSRVFKEMGCDVEYVFYPWRRCYESVKLGKAWAAFPYSLTEGRAKEVLFSEKISYSITRFFVYGKRKKIQYGSLGDLKMYKMGGVIGYFYEEALKKAGLNVDYASRESSALEMLKFGRTDLMPLNELVGWYLIKKQFPDELSNFKVLDKSFSKNDLHLIVSKSYPGSDGLLKKFNKSLKTVKDNYIYESILEKFLKQEE